MKKVLLLIAPLTDYPDKEENSGPDFEKTRLVSPIDAITAATILKSQGVDVTLFDLGIFPGFGEKRDEFLHFSKNNSFDFFVLVPPILTFATAADFVGKDFLQMARDNWNPQHFKAIITGTVPTNYPGKCISEGLYDYEIIGEFDFLLADLIQSVINKTSLPKSSGLVCKNNLDAFLNKGNRETK